MSKKLPPSLTSALNPKSPTERYLVDRLPKNQYAERTEELLEVFRRMERDGVTRLDQMTMATFVTRIMMTLMVYEAGGPENRQVVKSVKTTLGIISDFVLGEGGRRLVESLPKAEE